MDSSRAKGEGTARREGAFMDGWAPDGKRWDAVESRDDEEGAWCNRDCSL